MRIAWMMVSLIAAATQSMAASIGIYSTPTCSGSTSNVAAGETLTLYVVANPSPAPGGLYPAINSAEYRIVGLPPGWVATFTPGPATNVSFGDPFGNGVGVGFPTFLSGCLLLHTLVLNATSTVQDARLEVVAHVTPSGPDNCPLAQFSCGPGVACDFFRCVEGLAHILNATVATPRSTWSQLEAMYRD